MACVCVREKEAEKNRRPRIGHLSHPRTASGAHVHTVAVVSFFSTHARTHAHACSRSAAGHEKRAESGRPPTPTLPPFLRVCSKDKSERLTERQRRKRETSLFLEERRREKKERENDESSQPPRPLAAPSVRESNAAWRDNAHRSSRMLQTLRGEGEGGRGGGRN